MLAFRWRWSVAKNSAGFALALAQTLTSGPADQPSADTKVRDPRSASKRSALVIFHSNIMGQNRLRSLEIYFYYGNDEFLIYCYIYQFIPCKFPGWGKLSEKTFKEQQNNYTFRISSI